ncbi:hypothetical protein TNCV_3360851 [Trichonephila clavipes]|nr:hypothetical protein TNCV_3360851 [Trichonephila clavipes]
MKPVFFPLIAKSDADRRGKIPAVSQIAGKEFCKWVVRGSDPFFPGNPRQSKEHCAFIFSRFVDESASKNLQCAPRQTPAIGSQRARHQISPDIGGLRTRDQRRSRREPFEDPSAINKAMLSPRIKADFGTVKIAKEQLHGGLRASELTRTRCGFTEIERRTVGPL